MTLHISYFAWVRDRMECAQESLSVGENVTTVRDLILWLRDRDGRGAVAFADPARIRAAVDGAMAGPDAGIIDAQEIAFFPPVTGG